MLLDSRVRPRVTPFDVTDQFPGGWQKDIDEVAAGADFRDFPRTPILSREAADVTHITRGRVHAIQVQQGLPWLYKLYRHQFLELAGQAWGEPIEGPGRPVWRSPERPARQQDAVRVPRRLQPRDRPAVLHQPSRRGGELVIGHNPSGSGVEELERDGTAVPPQAGQLIFFDGRTYPHYARSLVTESDVRVVAVMNFYTGSCPESIRPRDLNRHLFGDEA